MIERPNILLVDDQPNNLIALEAMLADMDVNLVKAESGLRALKCLLEQEFAVILLDVQMPEMDGFATAGLIRQRDRSRHTPIIFVTALSRSETNVFRGYSLGAVDYLFKPIVPEILRSKVQVFVDLFRKSQELRQQQIELRKLHRQNDLILNSAAEGVLGVDKAGRSTFGNQAAANMIVRTVHGIVGRRVHDLFHPLPFAADYCQGANCPLNAALTPRAIVEVDDDIFWRSDGTSFPVEYSATPMLNEKGEPIGAVLTFRDVSVKRAAEMAVENERRYREAEAANRAKDEFLATLSHELRTPMTAILGWVRLLRAGDLDEESFKMAVESIERSASVQAQLIEDILDVSRIVAGKLRLHKERTNVGQIVERAMDTVRHTAEEKQIQLVSHIDPDAAPVEVDPARLQQVVWNLLSNAIKFTTPGGTVDVRLHTENSESIVEVQDSGQGISQEFLPFVFDRFRQANSSDTRTHGGLGLGLAIVRHIIEMHGGRVEARSDGEGRGSTFSVRLPTLGSAAISDGTPTFDATLTRRPGQRQADPSLLQDVKILLVDDEPDVRHLLVTILSRSGAEVTPASSVAEAVDSYDRAAPDVVISDVAMPAEDGYALVAKLRARNGGSLPIIALTAFGRDDERQKLLDAGFTMHLKKPIDPADLVEAVAEAARKSHPPLPVN
jgi:PAS domain S-box-containing protein